MPATAHAVTLSARASICLRLPSEEWVAHSPYCVFSMSQATEKYRIRSVKLFEGLWNPGESIKWGASDGLEYEIPFELLPNQEKWDKELREGAQQDGDGKKYVTTSVTMPKKMRDPALAKKLHGLQSRTIIKDCLTDKLGLVLGGPDGGPAEVVSVGGACHPPTAPQWAHCARGSSERARACSHAAPRSCCRRCWKGIRRAPAWRLHHSHQLRTH